jgi:hypothetical protein
LIWFHCNGTVNAVKTTDLTLEGVYQACRINTSCGAQANQSLKIRRQKMTTAIITGNLTDSGVVLTTTAANVSISNSTAITISSEYSELEFDFSTVNFGSNEIKIYSYTGTGSGRVYTLLGTVSSSSPTCTISVVTENLDFHYGLPSSTPNGLLGDSSDTTGEIIINK